MAEWELLLNDIPVPGITTLADGMREMARLDRRIDMGVIELRRVDYERRDNTGVPS